MARLWSIFLRGKDALDEARLRARIAWQVLSESAWQREEREWRREKREVESYIEGYMNGVVECSTEWMNHLVACDVEAQAAAAAAAAQAAN